MISLLYSRPVQSTPIEEKVSPGVDKVLPQLFEKNNLGLSK